MRKRILRALLATACCFGVEAGPWAGVPPSIAAEAGSAAPRERPADATPPRHMGLVALAKGVVSDFRHLPSRESLVILGIGSGAALALHPIDDDINQRFASKGFTRTFFQPGKIIGYGPVQIGGAVAAYEIGRLINKRGKMAHLGMDLVRAQIVTQSLTLGLKYATRRDRPDGSSGYSLPSGHASTTFATATVLERHLGWRAAVITYPIASYVAVSRLHENRHFASDVVAGATLGMIVGRTVTRHGRSSFALTPFAIPSEWGVALTRISR